MDSVSVEFKPSTSGTIRTWAICRSPCRRTKVQSCLKIHFLSSQLSAEGRPLLSVFSFEGLESWLVQVRLSHVAGFQEQAQQCMGPYWVERQVRDCGPAWHRTAMPVSGPLFACLRHGALGTGPGMSPERGVSKKEKINTICLPGNM